MCRFHESIVGEVALKDRSVSEFHSAFTVELLVQKLPFVAATVSIYNLPTFEPLAVSIHELALELHLVLRVVKLPVLLNICVEFVLIALI